jgi:Protein of unknown function (DUF1217)
VSYVPALPLGGVAGWRFLERTAEKQQATFEKSASVRREIAYFEERIGGVTSAADLVADRRLLKVALTAFGLEDKINHKAFVRKVLEEGTTADDALAVRLSDPAWKNLSAAFGFGDTEGGKTGEAGFAATIVSAYKTRAFEAAVGKADDDLRLAMNFRREIETLASAGEDGASLYKILGSKPLRKVFETAFGLPSSFVNVDIDRQRDILAARMERALGSDKLSVFSDPEVVEKMITRFLARAQIAGGMASTTPAAAALALLTGSSGSGSNGLLNLLVSKG